MLSYRLLFDKKNLAKQLIKAPNKYAKLLAKILQLKSDKIIEILVDSYFVDKYGVKFYNSELIIPGPLLQKERKGDFVRYISNIHKKLISGDKMSKYHSEEVLLAAKQGQGLFSDEVKKKFGTIFTPDFVVDKCIDLVWKYAPKDKNKLEMTYCDPASGDGNFLVATYDRLMKEESDLSPSRKSKHIIENCLWGFDIINGMVNAAKIALFDRHCQTCGDDFVPIEKFNIYWGNTICLPEDTEQEWYGQRSSHEGGMLDEHLRDKKFDVIVGNPPYTHFRNLGNRRYAAYPKQRDMAQVFVRWALDHLTEDGVIGYNTSYTWLNKTMDGSIDTRERVNNRVAEIVMTEDIVRYSEEKAGSGGGDMPTFVFAATANHTDFMLFNGKKIAYMDVDIMKAGFINMCENHGMKWPFRSVAINSYFLSDSSTQSTNKKGTNTDFLATFVYHKFEENGDFYLMTKRAVFEHTYKGSFKLVKCTDPRYTVNDRLESQIMHPKVSYQHGMCLIGYLNTDMAKGLFDKCTVVMPNHGGWCAKLASNKWHLFKVPDFDYYKQNRPERFEKYIKWIEENMHNKDKFLAGIDVEFERLIND